jgi:hypothetical protein
VQKAQQIQALQVVFGVSRRLRRQSQKRQEKESSTRKSRESESSVMGKVIEMKITWEREPMWLTGETLLRIALPLGRVLFDTNGTPVLREEFYEVSGEGIKRVA